MFVPTREQGLYLYVNRACVNRACVHTIESCPVECSLPCPVSFSSSVKCPESLDVVRPWAAHRCSIRIEYRYTGCNINTGFVHPSFLIYRYRCFLLYKNLIFAGKHKYTYNRCSNEFKTERKFLLFRRFQYFANMATAVSLTAPTPSVYTMQSTRFPSISG